MLLGVSPFTSYSAVKKVPTVVLQGKGPVEEGLPSWRRKVCYVPDSPPPLVESAEHAFLQVLSFTLGREVTGKAPKHIHVLARCCLPAGRMER